VPNSRGFHCDGSRKRERIGRFLDEKGWEDDGEAVGLEESARPTRLGRS
jgi:hypothetical protein